jgi:hypothetical protein
VIHLYHVANPAEQDTPSGRSPRCPPESFLNTLDARRYEYLAQILRECDRPNAAAMAERWAKEHTGAIALRADIERRRAAGEADIYAGLSINGGRAAE